MWAHARAANAAAAGGLGASAGPAAAAAAFGHLPPARSLASPKQLAEKTADVAQNTLVELHRQGQQLENAELGMDQVGAGRNRQACRVRNSAF